jgi:GH18 family chitinase
MVGLWILGLVAVGGADHNAVVAYLPEYRMGVDMTRLATLVSDVILFSIEPHADGSLNDGRLQAGDISRAVEARNAAFKNGVTSRVMVCVGGAGRSAAYGPMSSNSKTIDRFVGNLVKYCDKHKLDGIDFDWEGPANEEQSSGYVRLLASTSNAFKPLGLKVTVTVHGTEQWMANIVDYVDRVHLMAYDGRDSKGQHSTLEYGQHLVAQVQALKVPTDKIVLGIPAYGRNKKQLGIVKTYAEIVGDALPPPAKDHTKDGMYFNGVGTVQAKTKWAKEVGLAGVMVWEAGQDTEDATSLIGAIASVHSGTDKKYLKRYRKYRKVLLKLQEDQEEGSSGTKSGELR